MTVVGLRKVTGRAHLIGLTAIIVAIGTSFPEFFVAITSAIENKPRLSLGVALGSNIANIALIGAGSAILSGRVSISEKVMNKIVWISLICGMLPYALLLDGSLSRVDGIIMLLVYAAYILSFFRQYNERAQEEYQKGISFTKLIRKIEHFAEDKWRSIAAIFIGISLMLFSADTIVKFSNLLAERVNIPIFVIGLFILAIGTSLPEFAFSLRSLKDHEPQMFIGNLLGSVVANTTLVIGTSVLISPIYSLNVSSYLVPGLTFVAVYLLFYYFIRTKSRLERWEAGILLLIYIVFFLIELR
ncbi:MAG: Na+/Ca+ antiporter, CaCA family [Candidatus Woesebacteria bacterium GW2011_GWA1_39_21]|uniref:Na+/Ca+ antiporter, CaCA family n=1 Tax=Candidatus Woesebacteria bacterium GW2011_GWA1_39_21 TaxID=1618550 RepID=A0A0G0NGD1_9BACT|nr:MAG: Na+/Ca+ antiporter, CaCA family [Candidatus Woesebacteria bacterium GW2011_GWA1_39_21]